MRDVAVDAEASLWQLRVEADRADHARDVHDDGEEARARLAGRRVLDHIAVLLLRAEGARGEDAAVLDAIAAASVAEYARLEGRNDPARWRAAAERWEHAGRQADAVDARRRAMRRAGRRGGTR